MFMWCFMFAVGERNSTGVQLGEERQQFGSCLILRKRKSFDSSRSSCADNRTKLGTSQTSDVSKTTCNVLQMKSGESFIRLFTERGGRVGSHFLRGHRGGTDSLHLEGVKRWQTILRTGYPCVQHTWSVSTDSWANPLPPPSPPTDPVIHTGSFTPKLLYLSSSGALSSPWRPLASAKLPKRTLGRGHENAGNAFNFTCTELLPVWSKNNQTLEQFDSDRKWKF